MGFPRGVDGVKVVGWSGAVLAAFGVGLVFWKAGVVAAGVILMRAAASAASERRIAAERIRQEAVKAEAAKVRASQNKPQACAKPAAQKE